MPVSPLVDAWTIQLKWMPEDKRYLVVVSDPSLLRRKWSYAGAQLRGAPDTPMLDTLLNAVTREVDSWLF